MEHGKSKGQPAFPPEFVAMLKKHAGTDGKLDKAEFIRLLKQMHGSPPKAPTAAIYKSQKQHIYAVIAKSKSVKKKKCILLSDLPDSMSEKSIGKLKTV